MISAIETVGRADVEQPIKPAAHVGEDEWDDAASNIRINASAPASSTPR